MAEAPKNTKLANRKESAIKATRVSVRRRAINLRRIKAMKDVTKQFKKLVAGKGNAAELLPKAYQAIDKAVKGGVLKANTAARMKSGLAKKLTVK
jgi:small subunit ribosomal protein S20